MEARANEASSLAAEDLSQCLERPGEWCARKNIELMKQRLEQCERHESQITMRHQLADLESKLERILGGAKNH